jgi:HEPN domain-containing protein
MPPDPDAVLRESARRWIVLAQGDLDYAALGASSKHIPTPLVCFHIQQSVEKAVKAVLTAKGVDFPWTHDLENLAKLLPASGLDPNVREGFRRLTPFAVAQRYPEPGDILEAAQVGEFMDLGAKVLEWAKVELG